MIVVVFALTWFPALARRTNNQARIARHGIQAESGPQPKPELQDAGADIVEKVIEFGPIDGDMYEALVKKYIEPSARKDPLKASHEIEYDGGDTEEVLIKADPRGNFYNRLIDAYGHEVHWKLQRNAAQRKAAWHKKVLERDPSGASLPYDFTPLFDNADHRLITSSGHVLKCCCPDSGRPSYNTCRFEFEQQATTWLVFKKKQKCRELIGSDSYNSYHRSPQKIEGKGRGDGAGKCIATLQQMMDLEWAYSFKAPTSDLQQWTGGKSGLD